MTVRLMPLALLAVAGCTVGPDFTPPAPPAAPSVAQDGNAAPPGDDQRFVPGADVPADWWKSFRNDKLNALVDQALAANPTLAAAQAALRQAQENVAAQRGGYFPQVTAELSASRNLTPTSAVSPAGPTSNPYYSLVTPQLSVSFVPDVFGANTRAVESAQSQAEGQRFQLEATRLTLAANVVAGAVQEASLRGQVDATDQTIRNARALLAILRNQLSLGQAAGADVAAQEAALAQAELNLPPLRKQLDAQRDALTVLAGRFPAEQIEQSFDLSALSLPADLPAGLPSAIVRQRPDIRQAEENMHAASAQIGQAVAARIPQVTLSANLGNSSATAGNLFTPGTNFWTIGAGITAPLFDGFTLLHRERAARAAFDQAAAQYRATVLAAFQNVADSMRALQHDADALAAAANAERAAAKSLAIVKQQLALGQVAYLLVLNAQNTYQQARLALVQAQAARLADTAALFQSLGGGWWNRTDAKPE